MFTNHSAQSFWRPLVVERSTNERDPSGRACCGMQRSTSRVQSRLPHSFSARVASTNVLRDLPDVLGEAVAVQRVDNLAPGDSLPAEQTGPLHPATEPGHSTCRRLPDSRPHRNGHDEGDDSDRDRLISIKVRYCDWVSPNPTWTCGHDHASLRSPITPLPFVSSQGLLLVGGTYFSSRLTTTFSICPVNLNGTS
jgi:hypothetical protein